MAANPFVQLGISLLLGLLVGLQRQRAGSSIGGIRTFPLIAAFGTVCGLLAIEHGGWTVAAGLIAIAGGIFGLRIRDRSNGSVVRFLFGNGIDDQKREAWQRRFERADAVLSWLFIGAGVLLVAAGIATGNWVES